MLQIEFETILKEFYSPKNALTQGHSTKIGVILEIHFHSPL